MEATKAQPTAAPDPGARLVELIERSAAESVRRLVLDRALRGSGLDHPPTGAEDLADFLAGPLYDAARDVLDEEFAQALLLAVAPFLDPRHPDLVDDDGPPSRPASDRGYPFASTFLPPTVPRTVPRTDEPMRAQSAVQPRYEPLAAQPPRSRDTEPAPDEGLELEGALEPLELEGALELEGPATIPGPDSDRPPAPRSLLTASRDETPPPPPSRRHPTVPYLQAVLSPPRRRRRIMIIHAADAPRRHLATRLEKAGYAVLTAHDAQVARALHRRLAPTLVVADVETIAPDYEPLDPALEAVFGDQPPAHVVLLGDGHERCHTTTVERVLGPGSTVGDVLAEIHDLLPLESQRL